MDGYFERIKSGALKLHALEKELPVQDAVRIRREFLEKEQGVGLHHIGAFTIDIERVVQRNIENMIGTVQVPVGVAGPLAVRGEYARGSFYLPLATTEGALVASVNRGCSAVSRAGGAQVAILRDGMTRAPVFAAKDVTHAAATVRWVQEHIPEMQSAAEATTTHGKFLGASASVAGTSVFVRMEFDTKDAMGMNMVTIASEKVAGIIEEATGARLVALSGNMCTDKKPAAINTILGRGKTVVAGVQLDSYLIRDVFKTDPRTMAEVNYRKNLVGSARAASLGFNAQA
ncbi:MAG: 3-hydroxy-3-methylglutaryl-CoA reductase, partial [Methanomicrobiales archaeon]|nr:3-hydroxy-3-methylglutaryl-CoA reductase [Methanomicrobiales archaeon]